MRSPRWAVRASNRLGVWMYRTLDGRLSSGRRDVHVLMITAPGRRTALPRSTCVRYLPWDGGYLVWGTGSGSRDEPDWFRNLRAADVVTVQVLADVLRSRRRELLGEERDRVWRNVVLSQAPEVARYERRAGRTIPVALLTPVGASGSAPPGGPATS